MCVANIPSMRVLLRKSPTLLWTQPPTCKTCFNKGFMTGACRMLVTCHEPKERQRTEEVKYGRDDLQSKVRNVWEIRRRGEELPHRRQMLACLYKHPRCPLDPRRRSIPAWFPSSLCAPLPRRFPRPFCELRRPTCHAPLCAWSFFISMTKLIPPRPLPILQPGVTLRPQPENASQILLSTKKKPSDENIWRRQISTPAHIVGHVCLIGLVL